MYLSRGKERHYGVTIHHSETLSNGHIVCSVLYAICMRCSFLAQCKRQNHKSWRTNTTMLKMRKTITMWESMCKKRRCTQKSSGNKKIKEQLEIFEIFELRSIFLRFSFTTSVFFFWRIVVRMVDGLVGIKSWMPLYGLERALIGHLNVVNSPWNIILTYSHLMCVREREGARVLAHHKVSQ